MFCIYSGTINIFSDFGFTSSFIYFCFRSRESQGPQGLVNDLRMRRQMNIIPNPCLEFGGYAQRNRVGVAGFNAAAVQPLDQFGYNGLEAELLRNASRAEYRREVDPPPFRFNSGGSKSSRTNAAGGDVGGSLMNPDLYAELPRHGHNGGVRRSPKPKKRGKREMAGGGGYPPRASPRPALGQEHPGQVNQNIIKLLTNFHAINKSKLYIAALNDF